MGRRDIGLTGIVQLDGEHVESVGDSSPRAFLLAQGFHPDDEALARMPHGQLGATARRESVTLGALAYRNPDLRLELDGARQRLAGLASMMPMRPDPVRLVEEACSSKVHIFSTPLCENKFAAFDGRTPRRCEMRGLRPISLALVVWMCVGCGGGGGTSLTASQQEAVDCLVADLQELEQVLTGLIIVGEGVSQLPRPVELAYDDGTGAFTVDVDLGGGNISQVTGRVVAGDLSDGLAVDESFTVEWTRLGSGTWTVTRLGESSIRIRSTVIGTLGDGVDCDTVVQSIQADVFIADLGDYTADGFSFFRTERANGDVIEGQISFEGSIARYFVDFNGEPLSSDFTINLDTFQVG
ncbi:MAG: hypothetical protein AAGD14_16775 [Planctomycetota bacterium]